MKIYLDFLKNKIYIKENKNGLLFINIVLFFISGISLIIPYFSKIVVDSILNLVKTEIVTKYFFIFVILSVISLIFSFVQNITLSVLLEKIIFKFRLKLFTEVLGRGDPISSGVEMYKIFSDIPIVCNIGILLPTNLVFSILILIIANIMLATQSVISVIVINSCLTINIIVYSTYYFKIKKIITKYQEINAKQYDNVKNQLDKKDVIRAFQNEHKELLTFKYNMNELRKISVEKSITSTKFSSIFSAISSSLSILVLYVGYILVTKYGYSLGDIIVMNSFLSILLPYTNKIIDCINQFPNVEISLGRIIDQIKDTKFDRYIGIDKMQPINKIVLFHLNFAYSKKVIFKDLSICFDNNNTLTLIKGESGIGKSTLFKILVQDLKSSDYYVDEVNVSKCSQFNIKKHFSYYHNSFRVFDGTIMDNLTYGNEKASIDYVKQICKVFGIHDRIMELAANYYTPINSNNIILSSGEEQRICLARTLIRDSDFYLFDEPFSNLNSEISIQIIKNLKRLKKTCIIISHNLEKEQLFDRVITLKGGNEYVEIFN